jgi:endonuclease/exonuclease/phosphatase family metal-dependent hydrolase
VESIRRVLVLISGVALWSAACGDGADLFGDDDAAVNEVDARPIDAAAPSADASADSSIGFDGGADAGLDAAGSGSFTLLTYNVHGLPPIVTGDDTTARMTAIGPLLNGFDVVGLQEDFMPENHTILEDAANYSLEIWFPEKDVETRVYGSGLAVFANLVEVEVYKEHYTACNGTIDAGSDCLAAKGFLMVRAELAPGIEVDLYDTHLDAGGSSADDEAREVQVDQLIASMNTRSAGRAVIFMGDTNLSADDPDESPLLDYFVSEASLTDSCAAVGCAEPNHIDRILYRSSDAVTLSVETWTNHESGFVDGESVPLSDHPPVSVTFGWAAE